MKILKETTDPQTLRFIPRSFVSAVDLVIKNENTQVETTFTNLTATKVGGYLGVTEVFDLDEDTFYSFRVYSATEDIYRGKIFCTNQNPDEYSINNGEYLERDNKKEYILRDE